MSLVKVLYDTPLCELIRCKSSSLVEYRKTMEMADAEKEPERRTRRVDAGLSDRVERVLLGPTVTPTTLAVTDTRDLPRHPPSLALACSTSHRPSTPINTNHN